MADPLGYMIRFKDGPMAALTGAGVNAAPEQFDWPLPEQLVVIGMGKSVGMWDPTRGEMPEPPEGAVPTVYRKVKESQLPEGSDFLMRGAEYEVES